MAATDMYVTTTGAGTKSGLSWGNAFSLTEFETDVEGATEAGDRYFFKEGSYTLASAICSFRNGTSLLPIHLIGVVSATTAEPPTSSDWATGANRPLLTCGAHQFLVNKYIIGRNLRTTSTHSAGMQIGDYSSLINCSFANTGAAFCDAFTSGTYSTFIDCEFTSTNGKGLDGSVNLILIGCYAHDCGTDGFDVLSHTRMYHCIADTCTSSGILIASYVTVINCTVYNCTNGIYATTDNSLVVYNCTVSSCTNGFWSANGGALEKSCMFDYNNWHGNTHDMSWDSGTSEDNGLKGGHATANAPSFTDAAGGDFSLGSGSNLIDAGFSINLGVG